jgi:GNAT superfamily N-acetyltransferase
MIREYTKSYSSIILSVINDAAVKYKNIVPDNFLHKPYMSKQELLNEFSDKVRMFGYNHNNKLIGVIGMQKIKDVILIRHAYTLTRYQRTGIGSALIKYLLKVNQNSNLLVGTWQKATWAIRFYEKFGFSLHTKKQGTILLKKYWKISPVQIKNSIVLEKN